MGLSIPAFSDFMSLAVIKFTLSLALVVGVISQAFSTGSNIPGLTKTYEFNRNSPGLFFFLTSLLEYNCFTMVC